MSIKVGINGFGRIGRNVFRAALNRGDIDFVAVNDLTDTRTLSHLLRYDSVLGNLDAEIKVDDITITGNADQFPVLTESDPGRIDWASVEPRDSKKAVIATPDKGDVPTVDEYHLEKTGLPNPRRQLAQAKIRADHARLPARRPSNKMVRLLVVAPIPVLLLSSAALAGTQDLSASINSVDELLVRVTATLMLLLSVLRLVRNDIEYLLGRETHRRAKHPRVQNRRASRKRTVAVLASTLLVLAIGVVITLLIRV